MDVKQIKAERLRVENIIKVFLPDVFVKLWSFQTKANRTLAERMKKNGSQKES